MAEPISLQQAAERLGVHYMTAYRYVRTGRLSATREGTQWLVDPADVERLGVNPGTRDRGADEKNAEREQGRPRSRPRADRAATLTARMAAGDEFGAWRVIEDALCSGLEPREIYLDMLVPALRMLGDGWASGVTSVAEEHRASAVALRIVGRLGPRFARRGRKRGAVILGAVADDHHSLPSAIISDLLRGVGFEALDIGANTPSSSFVETAQQTPRLVAILIGVIAPGREETVQSTVHALRQAAVPAPVLVGGAAVPDADSALRLGADAWSGPDGRSVLAAVELAARRPAEFRAR